MTICLKESANEDITILDLNITQLNLIYKPLTSSLEFDAVAVVLNPAKEGGARNSGSK